MPQIDGLKEKTVSLVRCPVLVIAKEDDVYEKIRMIYSPHQFFMSNCSEPNCLVIYGKRIHKGEIKPQIDSIYANFPINAILNESRSIVRMLNFSANDMKETQKPLPASLSQYKYRLPKPDDYRRAYQLDSHLSRTEKDVMKLFEIITLTSRK